MSYINAVFQGLIQGFTEFLPISSSGHLSLYQYFTGNNSEASALFSILLHVGTLGAVFLAFWNTIWQLITEFFSMMKDLFTGKLFRTSLNSRRRMILMLIISCLPLLVVLPFQGIISLVSSDNSILTEGVCFLVTAAFLTLADRNDAGKRNAKDMTAVNAIAVGSAQALATLPGISRSGSTISSLLMLGFSKTYAVAYSFILGIPAILGALLLDLKDILGSSGAAESLPLLPCLIGMLVSFVSGLFAIRLVNRLIQTNKYRIFAVYTFILGVLVTAVALVESRTGNMIQQMVASMIAR